MSIQLPKEMPKLTLTDAQSNWVESSISNAVKAGGAEALASIIKATEECPAYLAPVPDGTTFFMMSETILRLAGKPTTLASE